VFRLPWRADLLSLGPRLWPSVANSNLFGVFMFVMLGASLFYFARKKLD
jgi:LPXTG-motif cell wall-anchored protein